MRKSQLLGYGLSLAVAFTLNGCFPDYFPRRHLRDTLSPADVVGTWSLQPESLRLLTREGLRIPTDDSVTISLKSDGSCEFRSVIEPTYEYVSARGSWELLHDVNVNSNGPTKNTLRIEILSAGEKRIQYLSFAREHGTIVLWTYYGDPDGRQYVEYSRRTKE